MLRNYLKNKSFIVYLLGKKNAGKGTYSKLFRQVVGEEYVSHLSIGDLVRRVHQDLSNEERKKNLENFLKNNYRGYISVEETLKALSERSTATLLPSEFILALVKREIAELDRKALFIDGFPRELDQVSYALFFRDLIGYRDDPDIFTLISLPESVIDERIKYRVICPKCQAIKNLKLYPPSKECIKYDREKKEFYFVCENPGCGEARMVRKEGDELGIKPIKNRLTLDGKLMEKAFSLHGIPKILLRNSVPVKEAEQYVSDYEITPEYSYKWNEDTQKVEVIEKPWQVVDDQGVPSYSLLPPPVVVSMLKQMVSVLRL